MFWTIMEGLHYPLATEIKQQMQQRLQEQQMMQQQAMQMQAMQQRQNAMRTGGVPNGMPGM